MSKKKPAPLHPAFNNAANDDAGAAPLSSAQLKNAPNAPQPQMEPAVRQAVAAVEGADVKDDPFLKALQAQTLNHLKHVGFHFNVENETYPHALVLEDAYPAAPTLKALQKTSDFLDVCKAEHPAAIKNVIDRSEADIRNAHDAVIRNIIQDPLAYHEDARRRLAKDGLEASFPEFKEVVDLLLCKIETDPRVAAVTAGNPHVQTLAALTHDALTEVSTAAGGTPSYAYQKTLDAIERGVEFFDVITRGLSPEESPPLYHSGRYEYYSHYLAAEVPEHVFFPTIYNLSIIDLIRVRGVPLGFVGVFTDVERVDGFPQTPYEFYMHDVNHSRRMQLFARECARDLGISEEEFCHRANAYVHEKLLPEILIQDGDDAATRTRKNIKKMILFETLHEDALAADPGVVRNSILRPPGLLTAFERIDGDTVTYIMEPGATTLAYVYRKLAHTFYDRPEHRFETIVDTPSRTRAAIAEAAKELYANLDLGPVPAALIDSYVATDEGFPEDFKRTLEDDIEKRGLEKLGSKADSNPGAKPGAKARKPRAAKPRATR